jgi:hypothetical protein
MPSDWDGTGKENIYSCPRCGGIVVTIDRDKGTTPMFLTCGKYNRGGCGYTMMHSHGYPAGPRPAHIPPPTHEWYRPDDNELYHHRTAVLEYVRKGGLFLREIKR